MKQILAVMLAIVITISFCTVSLAQDAAKKEMKKEEMKPLKSVSCDPACGFMVRSHDEKELASIVIQHAKKAHNMKLTEKQVKEKMKTEETPEK